jgi:hypothetical protein
MSKKITATKKLTTAQKNVVLNEAVKAIKKSGKKIVAGKKAEVKVETPSLDELLSKVETAMAGRSAGTINSAKNLITKVCKLYGVTSITEEIAQKALADSPAAPKSKANLKWAMKIAVAASA